MDTLLGWCSHGRSAGLLPYQVLKELVSGKGVEGAAMKQRGRGTGYSLGHSPTTSLYPHNRPLE